MPVLGKVLESVLNERLIFKNKVMAIDDPLQFGFMEHAQTIDNMYILQTMIMKQKFN
jgi:hypothetical protein